MRRKNLTLKFHLFYDRLLREFLITPPPLLSLARAQKNNESSVIFSWKIWELYRAQGVNAYKKANESKEEFLRHMLITNNQEQRILNFSNCKSGKHGKRMRNAKQTNRHTGMQIPRSTANSKNCRKKNIRINRTLL